MGRLTFNHSGDIGDAIYSFPTIRALGGGHLFMWPYRPGVRTSRASVESLATLLPLVPYIDGITYSNRRGAVDLDSWCRHYRDDRSIAQMHLAANGCNLNLCDERWITPPAPARVAPVLIHRSARYHNGFFPWRRIVEKYAGRLAMVGQPDEHEEFCRHFGDVPHVATSTFISLAAAIAGAELFIGNQSSPYAIAEGMKHRAILEVSPTLPNCRFTRPGLTYASGAEVSLPDLSE